MITQHLPVGAQRLAQDFLAVVDVVQEGVQRPHPLLDPAFQEAPLGGGDR